VTWGAGKFWPAGPLPPNVIATDLEPERAAPHGVANFLALPDADASHDVVWLDPPHNGDSKRGVMGKRFGSGTYTLRQLREEIFPVAIAEAWRVAKPGVVIKVCDQVRNEELQLESDWVRAAVPMPLYDYTAQTLERNFEDPRWT
jgi:hypothetical protein